MDALPAAPATPVRYDDLDALRGWAFLGVLSVHTAFWVRQVFPGLEFAVSGMYGVQLFFMISAFTIFLTLDRAGWRGWWTCEEFFIRRFFRILPMFWLGLVLYAFVPGRARAYAGMSFTPLDYVLTATLQHGWWPRICNALVPGGWSIAAEGVFYLVAPLGFRLVRTWQAALGLLLGSLVCSEIINVGMASFYQAGWLFAGVSTPMVNTFLDAWFPTQLPVFACGILAYHLIRPLERQPWSRATGALLLALSALWLYTAVGIGKHGVMAEHVFFALGFLPLMVGLKTCPTRLLVNSATQFLGRISYSAYLLHFAVLEAVWLYVQPLRSGSQNVLLTFVGLFGAALLGTVPLAWLTYRYVERPCIDLGAAFIRHRRAAAATTATPAGAAVAAVSTP